MSLIDSCSHCPHRNYGPGHGVSHARLDPLPWPVLFHAFREEAILPTQATPHAACWDVYAWNDNQYDYVLNPGETLGIPTGLNIAVPRGHHMAVRSRSGLAAKHGVHVLNAPGTIDSDYCGIGPDFEVKVILHNSGPIPFHVKHGDRIAQMRLEKDLHWVAREADEEQFLAAAERLNGGTRVGGFGSTGR